MTDTAEPRSTEVAEATDVAVPDAGAEPPAATGSDARTGRGMAGQIAVALLCAVLGFVLVAQVRATEHIGERLEAEREEDLARILSDLSSESDRLQTEITDLRLLLIEFETSQEAETLTLRNLERRLADLQVLTGSVAAEGEGVQLTVEDPVGGVTQELLVDTVQELRDAGAEAIAVNGVRLVVSSAFSTRNDRLVLDGQPLAPPYRIQAIGPADTMARALEIPGGVTDTFARTLPDGVVSVEQLAELSLPARPEPSPFIFGEPLVDTTAGGD